MFLIDTNVISESRKLRSGRAAPELVAWLKATDPSTTFISVMSLFELELGVVRIERRDPAQGEKLRRWLDHIVIPGFAGRVLAMDSAVAVAAIHPSRSLTGWVDRGNSTCARLDGGDAQRRRFRCDGRSHPQSVGR